MIRVKNHLGKLGYKAVDKVTGFKGVVTCIGFDLYGCVQCVLNPGIEKTGKLGENVWFDIGRISLTSEKPVMNAPNYEYGDIAEGRKGAAEKPKMFKA